MSRPVDFEKRAEECQKMAKVAVDAAHKKQYELMADAWTQLAREAERLARVAKGDSENQ